MWKKVRVWGWHKWVGLLVVVVVIGVPTVAWALSAYYPSSVVPWTDVGSGDVIEPAHVNQLYAEVQAIETDLESRHQSLYLPAKQFDQTFGAPNYATDGYTWHNRVGVWRMPDSSDSTIGTSFQVPDDWDDANGDMKVSIYFVMDTATSGNVTMDVQYSFVDDGENFRDNILTYGLSTFAVPGAAGYLKEHTWATTRSGFSAGDIVRFSIYRNGGHAHDTATGYMNIVGARVYFE